MNQNQTLLQLQAQRGLPYVSDVNLLRHPIAWRFGVEIKGIMFMRLQQPEEDYQVLREQHPGVFIIPHERREEDFGFMGLTPRSFKYRTQLGTQMSMTTWSPLSEARALGIPHPEYRWWTMKDNASVGISLDDLNDYPHIAGYHAFSFELVSPIFGNTERRFRELSTVINLLYSHELLFNDTGGIDVHVGIDQYMLPLPVVRRIAAVCLASDVALVRYHSDHKQDNQHRLLVRNTSNVAHGMTAQQAQRRNPMQLDGTVNFENRRPPPTTVAQCVREILNADSYATLDKLFRIDRGVLPTNYNFPTYTPQAVRGGPRATTTIEFCQYSANMDHADDLVAWIKVCLRICSFAASVDEPTLTRLVDWCHSYEYAQQGPEANWRELFRGFGGLDDVLNYYENDVPLVPELRPSSAEERMRAWRDWRDGPPPRDAGRQD
ncbi:hypothetical protein PG993_000867 [Apiospora rasikravindrae]|uniref:Uncharacterized protein n=1 Tax=Apiospora rasikravindrae TaxID=990691 RepID=A0ABR1UC10_9PEZI